MLELRGELDLLSAPKLQELVEQAPTDERGILVLDLHDLEFVDSAGLRVILAAHEHVHDRGHEFALTKGSEQVQRLLSIAGVAEHLRIIEAPDAALV